MRARRVVGKEKYKGLMFAKSRAPILIDFGQKVRDPIHSFFVPFKFYALWIDDKGKAIEGRWVKPWRWGIKPKDKPFVKILEIPEPVNPLARPKNKKKKQRKPFKFKLPKIFRKKR